MSKRLPIALVLLFVLLSYGGSITIHLDDDGRDGHLHSKSRTSVAKIKQICWIIEEDPLRVPEVFTEIALISFEEIFLSSDHEILIFSNRAPPA